MTYKPPFPYSAADYRARKAGLAVLGCHYATLPPGVPARDHYGNYVQAQHVWIGAAELGKEAIGSADCAYATVVQSIHCLATPNLGTALAEIRRAILTVQEFPSREDYVAAMLPYGCRDETMLSNAWVVELDCALRAQRTLPTELVSWLISLDCGRW